MSQRSRASLILGMVLLSGILAAGVVLAQAKAPQPKEPVAPLLPPTASEPQAELPPNGGEAPTPAPSLTPDPDPRSEPEPAPAIADPEKAAAEYVARTRTEVESNVKALQEDAGRLRERLRKVESALLRWEGLLSALTQEGGQPKAPQGFRRVVPGGPPGASGPVDPGSLEPISPISSTPAPPPQPDETRRD